ncbi:lysylphosphatidylglycerol synthase transmembrane domain-containing protein [uncultured Methanoregula sp.]|uniref:lysylphosphatidylglycerol synthase transmembrane domain-containing protein n=1 Tax=uncultured Methanoregula sp. TaxID=1005933 RepID=UPI002AAB5248|nr:lysylphosphatidylglycerol synthase transmembrane domain-containing protein [uncultured Methanoregula sp.]
MKNSIKLLSLVGIVLFIVILSRINLGALFEILSHTSVIFLILAFLVNCVAIVLKSLKWKIIVNSVKPSFTFRESMIAFFVGFSFSTITPAKLGDFIKVLYITDENCGLGKSLATVVIDRLIDIVLLFSIALIAICSFSLVYHIEILSVSTMVLILAAIGIGLYIVLNKPLLARLLRPFFNIFVPGHLKDKLTLYFNDFYTGLFIYYHDRRRFFSSISIGIISWIPPFIYGYLLALSIGIDTGLMFFVLVIPILSLLDLLPISISGIGTRDVALIFLFGLKAISPEQAVAFSLLYLFMSYWLIALIGAGVYLRYPVKIPEEMS